MSWFKSCWHYILVTLISILCIVTFLIVFLLSPSGFKSLCTLSEKLTSHRLSLTKPQGSLRTSIGIEKVEWRTDNLDVTIYNFATEIHLMSLLKGSINIEQLIAKNIDIKQIPALYQEPSKSISEILTDLPSSSPWPTWLQLHNLSIQTIQYKTDHSKIYSFENIHVFNAHNSLSPGYEMSFKSSGEIQSQWQAYFLPMPEKTNIHIVGNYADQAIEVHGFINTEQLYIDDAKLSTSKGSIDTTLQYQFQPSPVIVMKSALHHFFFHEKQLNGFLNITLQAQQNLTATINIHTQNSPSEVYLNLNHDNSWNADWHIHINQLSAYVNDTEGSINSDGSFYHKHLTGNGQIHIQKFLSSSIQLLGFNAQWNVEKNNHQKFHSTFSFKSLNYYGTYFKDFLVLALGNQNNQNMLLNLTTPWHQQIHANIKGVFNTQEQSWQGSLSKLSIQQSKQAIWQLKKTCTITVNTQNIVMTPLELFYKNYDFYLEGNYALHESWKITSHAQLLFSPTFLQNKLFNSVDASYEAGIQGRGNVIQTINLTSNQNITLHLKDKDKALNQLINLKSNLTFQNGQFVFLSTLMNNQKNIGTMDARSQIDTFSQLKKFITLPFTCDLNIHIPKLIYSNVMTDFVPSIVMQSGLDLFGRFKGTLIKPAITLHVKQSGNLYSEVLNKNFQNTNLTINPGAPVPLMMTTHLDATLITLNGSIVPSLNNYTSQWYLKSDQMQIMNQPEQQLTMIPNLSATCINLKCTASGKIQIPTAHYQIQPVYASSLLPSEDISYIYNNPSKQIAGLALSNLTIDLGNDIEIIGYGLNGKLRGSLTLNKKLNAPLLFDGALYLKNAHLEWSTNPLNFKIAQISYLQSPPNNPNLHIVGEKNIQIYGLPGSTQQSGTVTVGISMSGTVNHPIINLYASSAALSQADILSYLLFNQPASSTTLLNSATLITTLKSAGKQSTNPLNSIEQKLGLNELGIETQSSFESSSNISNQNNQFVVGKKLWKKLYLRYAMGLGSSTGSVAILIYQFNHRWSLQSSQSLQKTDNQQNSQSGGSAIDLMYQFSK